MKKPLLIAAVSVIFFLSGVLFYYVERQQTLSKIEATVLIPQKALPDFQLTDHNETPLTKNELHNQWSLVFFGYTYCPDICPTTLAMLRKSYQFMEEYGIELPRIIFVSVDPARDAPGQLKQYTEYFNPDFLSATGTEENLLMLTRALGAVYMINKPEGEGDDNYYTVDHSGSMFLINPDAELTAIFSMPHDAKDIAKDVKRIQKLKL